LESIEGKYDLCGLKLVLLGAELFDGQPGFLRCELGRRAVLVGCADVQHLVAAQDATLSGARSTFRLTRVTCRVDRDDSSVRCCADSRNRTFYYPPISPYGVLARLPRERWSPAPRSRSTLCERPAKT